MKLSQLLTGTAVAALCASGAFAQATTDLVSAIDPGADLNPGTSVELVPELDFSSANLSSTLEVAIIPDNNNAFDVYANTAAQLTISLDGFEFASNIAGGSFVTNWAAGAGADCAFTVVAGGVAGDTSVTFETADLSNCDASADEIGFVLPVTLTGLPATYSFELRQKSNNALIADGEFDVDGNANTPTEIVVASGGFEIAFLADGNTMTALLADPTYNTLSNGDVGTVDFNASGDIDLNGNGADWEDGNQVDGIEVTVTLSDPSGIESVTIDDGANNMTETLVNGVATFTIDGSSDIDIANITNGLDVSITEDNDDNTLIQNGTVSISVTVDEDAASNLDIADASSASDETDEIEREGTTTNIFEWVGDSSLSTSNVFRITGLDDTIPTIRVNVSNSSNDLDGEYEIDTSGKTVSNGELILTSADLTAAAGAFGRADVTLSFEANGVAVRRFMVTNGVVSENSTDYETGAGDITGEDGL